jgi:UDP-glucose 4-epimerase
MKKTWSQPKGKILVTGHRGFIGSYLTDEWLEGADYIGIDLKSGLNLLTCELPEKVDLIYHLAAQADAMASWKDPLHDLDNIRMTARLVKTYPKATIVYANSCAAMDTVTPYGFSKWASGEYIKRFHKNYVSCVFPNIYGEGSRSVVDIFKGREKVIIYGDGFQTRDFVHVEDIARGLKMASKWKTGEYFMGSGQSTSVLDLAGFKKILFKPKRDEPYEVNVPNTTPNWKPKINIFDYVSKFDYANK